jgi:hypothetical protein
MKQINARMMAPTAAKAISIETFVINIPPTRVIAITTIKGRIILISGEDLFSIIAWIYIIRLFSLKAEG